MNFTEDEILIIKISLAQYMYINLDNVDLSELDLKKMMLENGIITENESQSPLISLVDKLSKF